MCRTKLQRARSPCAGILYHHVDVPRWPPEREVGVFCTAFFAAGPFGRAAGAATSFRGAGVVSIAFAVRLCAGQRFIFAGQSALCPVFHALHEKYFPCQADTLPYTAKRCGKLDCQAEAPCAFHLHRETVQTSPLCQAEAAIGRVLFHKWGGDVAASPPTPSRRQKIYIKEKEI